MEKRMFIIRFLDGREYIIGPFKSADAAQKYLDKQSMGGAAVIQRLSKPEK